MRTKDKLKDHEASIAKLYDIVNDLHKQIKKLNDPLEQRRRRLIEDVQSFNARIEEEIQTLGRGPGICPEDYIRLCSLRRVTKSLALVSEDLRALS